MTPAQDIFLGLVALEALLRIGEIVAARVRTRSPERVREPLVFPVMVALHTAYIVAPVAEVFLYERPFNLALGVTMAALLALAMALRFSSVSALGEAWTIEVAPPASVATGGPYRFVRHPNDLAVIVEMAALPLFHGAWLSATLLSLVNAWVLGQRIRTEETILERDPRWVKHFGSLPRFIPGCPPPHPVNRPAGRKSPPSDASPADR